ncbi:hypothetical protein [Microbulbifer sp. 2205BS26-8]|uniref:hypothetical protein n=1 Tax=Microbulbifer sp. 2205BS26-8 TaxID=3064386 RepID=UPI00273F461F|nr:hypothetical protein [Microbulbifer sp. 2205BS26-8]MDP5210004.1 hypothetical protein [Microbulbifer sp. 2205BS26-8]
MSYTQTDLDNIDRAISEMAMGERVGEFRHNGRQIKYADVTLPQLRALRKTIAAAVQPERRRYSRIITDKGL